MLDVSILDSGSITIEGCSEVRQDGPLVSLLRLPDWAISQVPDPVMGAMVSLSAGVSLHFETDACQIELDVLVESVRIQGREFFPPVFELHCDGELVSSKTASDYNIVDIDPSALRVERSSASNEVRVVFEGLRPSMKKCEVSLPTNACVRLKSLRLSNGATITATPVRPRWIHYGSSISHCVDVASPHVAWPNQIARYWGRELLNLSFAGQCQLDPFVARTIAASEAEFVTMKVGVNLVNAASMTLRTFAPALDGFIDTVRSTMPNTPIVVFSPIYCSLIEDSPGPTFLSDTGRFKTQQIPDDPRASQITLVSARELVSRLVERRRAEGDERIWYGDGATLLGESDAHLLYDDLHPSADGYRLLGERFRMLIEALGLIA